VKVTDIARQARTSPATFYQYFANVEQAIRVLADGLVDEAAQLADLVGGDWSEEASWETARMVTEGFLTYWPHLLGGQPGVLPGGGPGDRRRRRAAARHPGAALNAVTVALARVIAAASTPPPRGPAAPRRTYLSATGLRGEPTPSVSGSGVASSRNV
jgi:AcrR family transcriptional regulator